MTQSAFKNINSADGQIIDNNSSDELILVDFKDQEIGHGPKLWVHQNDKLHRAFSVFIVCGDEMLIQRRNPAKYHSGGLYANACCSHPRKGESLKEALPRRLKEELGVDVNTDIPELFSFVYRTEYANGFSEYEYDHVFILKIDKKEKLMEELSPDEDEIAELKWISLTDLEADMLNNPSHYSSWFTIATPRVLEYLR